MSNVKTKSVEGFPSVFKETTLYNPTAALLRKAPKKQIKNALNTLFKLSLVFPRAVLGGAACHNWSHGVESKDVDIFIPMEDVKISVPSFEALMKALFGSKAEFYNKSIDDSRYQGNPDIKKVFELAVKGVVYDIVLYQRGSSDDLSSGGELVEKIMDTFCDFTGAIFMWVSLSDLNKELKDMAKVYLSKQYFNTHKDREILVDSSFIGRDITSLEDFYGSKRVKRLLEKFPSYTIKPLETE